MVELQWRLLTTLFYIFIIAAGTLAAANCSRLYHCAFGPYSGTEHRWGISLTQDSRDSDFYSGCHSNRGGRDAHRVRTGRVFSLDRELSLRRQTENVLQS